MQFDLQLSSWWPMAAALAATVGGGQWWYRRRVAELLARMERLERARQGADQMAQQARRQVEQLQKDLATQHRAQADAARERRRTMASAASAAAASSAAARSTLECMLDDAATPPTPKNGFADTQPMSR